MNKTILFSISLTLIFFGCSKKEDTPVITIDKDEITIQHNVTSQLSITPIQDCIWSTADTNVAVVSGAGLVTGVRLGDTKITVTSKENNLTAECIVHVTPKSNLYIEPYYVWGVSPYTVIAKETRKFFSESPTILLYEGENTNIRYVGYMFNNDSLTSADVMLANNTSLVTEAKTFLDERYPFYGLANYYAIYKINKNTFAALNSDSDLGLNVLYFSSQTKGGFIFSELIKFHDQITSK